MQALQVVASRIISHLLCIKTDIQYFVNAVQDLQVAIPNVVSTFIEDMRYLSSNQK